MNLVKKAIKTNGIKNVLVNKMDIMQEIAKDSGWHLYLNNGEYTFAREEDFKDMIIKQCPNVNFEFSYSPE